MSNFLPEIFLLAVIMFLILGFPKKSGKYDAVSAVIPAFNEQATIKHVIDVLKQVDCITQIIVVDDGSTDNTPGILSGEENIEVLVHRKNRGKGSAMTTGLRRVVNDVVLFLDADLETIEKSQVEAIIRPILKGDADITKTKFKREAGRVTELTAKPLLQFFFPELSFSQPLSGQFAAVKSFLDSIDLENDYGVDIGIILDAEAQGLKIQEVDIGTIVHDHSTLEELNFMATEVVRTIVDRAINYGRLTMVDDLGNSIRMEIMGLSLVTFGIFGIFFIKFINLYISFILIGIGIIISVYYIFRIIRMSLKVYRQSNLSSKEMTTVFMKTHFPVVISVIILLVLTGSLLGSMNISSNQISIEPVTKNMVIPTSPTSKHSVDIRGPYTISNALEDEEGLIRLSNSAASTLQVNYGDNIYIAGKKYRFEQAVNNENDLIRIPAAAREQLGVTSDTVIRDSDLTSLFKNSYIIRNLNIQENNPDTPGNININTTNVSVATYTSENTTPEYTLTIYINNTKIGQINANIKENTTYPVYINDKQDGIIINPATNSTIYNTTHKNTTINITLNTTQENTKTTFTDRQSNMKFLNIHIK